MLCPGQRFEPKKNWVFGWIWMGNPKPKSKPKNPKKPKIQTQKKSKNPKKPKSKPKKNPKI